MNRQDVMDSLAEVEKYLSCKLDNPGDLSEFYTGLIQMHHNINALREQWYRITGCKVK